MPDTTADPQELLIRLALGDEQGAITGTRQAAKMLSDVLTTIPDDLARTVVQASDVWCGLWRFVATACGLADDPDGHEDVAMEIVDDVVALSEFRMDAFSNERASGGSDAQYCARSSWTSPAEGSAAALGDEDEISYAIDHSIVLLACAGMIVVPDRAYQIDSMREGCIREIADLIALNAEASAAMGCDIECGPAEYRNVAVEHLVRAHGRRNPDLDTTRMDEISKSLSIDLDVPTGGLAVMAEVHKVSDPTSWDEIRRRNIDETTVLQAAWMFLAIDEPNTLTVDLSDPIGIIITAAAFTTACAALLRTDPMEATHSHPSASMLADRWGSRTPAEASVPGMARDNMRALIRRCVAWDALVHDARDPSDLAYVVEACLETMCLDADRRADDGTDWIHYGIASTVTRYAAEVHSKDDLAWLDVVESTGLTGSMAKSQDPLSMDRIAELMDRGRPVHHGRVVPTHAVLHCTDPTKDEGTLRSIRTVLPGCSGITPGRGAYERVVTLDPKECSVEEAVALAENLMAACGVHGAYVIGGMADRPFVALAGHDDEHDAYVGSTRMTKH